MTLLSGKLVSPKRALGLLSLIAMLFGLSPLATAQEATDAPAPLRIAIDRAYSPYSLIGPTGEATGLAVEMWRAWSEATGTPVEFVASGWEETLEALRTGKVDAHFGMFKYASRAEWADFAEPIHQIHTALFFRAGEDEMVPLKDLAGEKVGVWAETYQHQFLKDNFPDIKAVASKSDDQLILKLLNGDVRAILNEVPSVDADLASFGIRGVLTRSEKILFSNYVQPAVRKGETALLELINEGFRKVSIDRLHELEKLWMSSPSDHFYAGAGGQVEFTLEEEAWLDANPAITLAVTTFIQPVDVIDEAGNYSGMNADLINMLNQKLGINIVPEFFDSWGKVVKATTGGTVDGAFSLSITPEREKSVLFTKPYAFDPIIAIVPRTSNDILDWKDLNGKNVSVVKGASIIEEIQGMLGDGALITVESEADGLKQVESGAADIHVSWLLPYGNAQRSDPVDGLKIALTRNSEGGSLRIGIHKDRPELLGILRKGLNAISREELTAVRNKWLFPKDASMDMPVTLRADELGWMQAHPIIRLAVLKDYAPFDFTNNDGTHSGLHSDLLKLINKHLGANIVAIPFDTWKEAYDKAASGDLDGIMSLGWTKEREKTFLFSTPYHYDPADMVVQDIDGSVKSWRALNGKTIWVRNSSSLIRKIKKDLPDANIIEADSEAYALEQLASGNGDAYLAWISADKSKLRSMGLKVAASVDTRQGELLIGVHRSRPLVAGIIQKGLGSISAKEMAALRSKWLFSEQQMADLTAEEWAWVENRTIKVGVEQWAPLVFLDNSGNLQGLAGGFLRRVSNATGLKFEIVGDEWASLLGDFKERKIDLLPATYFTEERATYGLYSDPFFYMREYVYVKDGSTDISSIKDIADKRIAVVKGYGTIPKIRAKYPKATIVETNNLMTSIDAVLNSEVDALIEAQMVVEHTIKTNAIIGLKGISQSVFPASPLHFFSRIDEPILQSILQKGLDAITEEEERAEIGKWISATKTERQKLGLSIDEQGWLSEHENIRLGVDTSWPPFEFVDEDGKYSGVSSGYIDVISKRLELSMQAVPGINWSQAIEKIKFGELDVLPAVARTPEREAFLNFTKPYVKVPMVIATHKDGPVVGEVGDLEGKSVGVVTGYASAELLRADFPKLNFIEMNSVAALLLALSEGKIDTAFENLWVISYEKERLSLDDVKIAVPTSYNIDLSMGVRKDWPELVPILDKALASIDKQQSTTIRNAWMAVEVKFGLDMKTVLIWAVPAGGGVLLIIAFVVGWNRRLGAEIDERKRAEEELAKRTNLIQAVLGSLTQGIVAFDKDLKLIAWNNHYKEIRDYPSELLEEGRDFRDFMQYDVEREEFYYDNPDLGIEEQLKRAKLFEPHAFERQRPDGSFIDVSGGPIPGGGFVSTFTDVTNRKRDELELKIAKVRAEEATKAKASFLAAMSHEIRTPMNGVIGMIDLLQQTDLNTDQQQMSSTVRDSAYALLTIINDILDFSKIEAGKLDLEAIPVSISELVDGVADMLAPNVRAKGIRIKTFVDPDIPDAVISDPVRLRQILFNIGGNAVKFTESGKVLIRADKMLSPDPDNINLRFQVIDNGIGIPKKAQAKLFQAFSQVDASTTRRFGGTGLGLTICQRLVEIMKGKIGVESEEGEGATFNVTVILPVAAEHDIDNDGHDLKDINILLALKDDDTRGLYARYLEHCKATVTTTEAIENIEQMALDATKNESPFQIIGIGSGWPIDAQIKLVKSLQGMDELASTNFVVSCASRDRADRPEIDKTIYLDADPMRRSNYIRSFAVAAGRASPDTGHEDNQGGVEKSKVPTIEEAEAAGQLILVAEDNPTNQLVINRQINNLGYAVVIGDDGEQAQELLQSHSVAILLTDCHMPNMDGFELTKSIRDAEEGKDERLPIIAITASVMKEEIDRCFESGMDGYLPKPLEMNKLGEMLKKWMPVSATWPVGPDTEKTQQPPDTTKVENETAASENPVIDDRALKDIFGDDDDTFKEILGDFVEPSKEIVQEIKDAYEARDAKAIGAAGHKLKSSSRSVGANALSDLCATLEKTGKAEDWDGIDDALPHLEPTLGLILEYIEGL